MLGAGQKPFLCRLYSDPRSNCICSIKPHGRRLSTCRFNSLTNGKEGIVESRILGAVESIRQL
jgi:hypothetical protein